MMYKCLLCANNHDELSAALYCRECDGTNEFKISLDGLHETLNRDCWIVIQERTAKGTVIGVNYTASAGGKTRCGSTAYLTVAEDGTGSNHIINIKNIGRVLFWDEYTALKEAEKKIKGG